VFAKTEIYSDQHDAEVRHVSDVSLGKEWENLCRKRNACRGPLGSSFRNQAGKNRNFRRCRYSREMIRRNPTGCGRTACLIRKPDERSWRGRIKTKRLEPKCYSIQIHYLMQSCYTFMAGSMERHEFRLATILDWIRPRLRLWVARSRKSNRQKS
jgi:hypothetical protein